MNKKIEVVAGPRRSRELDAGRRGSCAGAGVQRLWPRAAASPRRVADLAAPRTPLPRVRSAGCSSGTADAHLRASSPWLVKSLFRPDQVTFGLRDGSQEEVGVCGDGD